MSLRETPNIIKSFLPIFYPSKYFGCNLFPLPRLLSPSNVKINLRAVDILICLIHFGLSIGVTIPFIKKWDSKDSPLRKELESKISLSSVVMMSIIGSIANYAYVVIYLFIMIIDMINASTIRKILVLFINFDEQIKKVGVKVNLSFKHISMLHTVMILVSHVLTIAFGISMMNKQNNGEFVFVLKLYIASITADGCVSSFFVSYWYFLENVADRFAIINERLRQCIKHSRRGFSIDLQDTTTLLFNDSNLKCDYIRNLSKLHYILFNIVTKINSCYALQFIFSISVTFLFLIMNFFVFYKTLTVEMEYNSPIMEIFYTTRSVYFNFLIYKIIAIGSRIKNTVVFVNNLNLPHLSGYQACNSKKITLSLLNKAMALCKSEAAIAEVSAAIGSYLLLFIQFDSVFTN